MTPLPIEEQLHRYADSIDHDELSGTVTEISAATVRRATRRRRGMWALSAVAACVIGLAAVFVASRGPVEVETGDVAVQPTETALPTPVTEQDPSDADESVAPSQPVVQRRYLLPDPEQWVVVEDYRRFDDMEPRDDPAQLVPAIWVWELDGDKRVFFQTGERVAYGEAVPLAEAQPQGGPGRLSLGWLTPTGRVGLLGFSIEADELNLIARQLDQDVVNPTIEGATLVVHEPETLREPGRNEQLNLAPVGVDGVPQLNLEISASARKATPADLYRELSEASSLGDVIELPMAGYDGFVIDGSTSGFGGSYAVVAIDGWVYRWQANSTETDLVALLESVTEVTEAEWEQAAAEKDANIAAAAEAAVAQSGIDTANLAPPADLPRYLLGAPWEIEWITDMGIWTDEQRAQRAGRFQANSQPVTPLLASRTQAFRFTPEGLEPTGFIAGVEVSIAVFESPPTGPRGFQEGSTQIEVAGLAGMASPENLTDSLQRGALNTIEVEDASIRVFIQSQTLEREHMVAFAESLEWRSDDPGDGFDATDQRFDLLVDELNESEFDPSDLLAAPTSWHAAWRFPDDPSRTVNMTVEKMPLTQAPLEFSRRYSSLAANIVEVRDDTGAVRLQVDLPGVALRYDSRTELFVLVTVKGGQDSPTDIIETGLIEVGLEEWTTRVTPFNDDPLNGR